MPSKKRVHLQQSGIISQKHVTWDAKSHTHTDYIHHWYIRKRLQCGHIFMTRYAKSHTHRSCSQVVDLAARGHRTSSISADSLETWFLSWLIKESFCIATLILVCKTKASLIMLTMRYVPSRFWLLPHLTCEHKRKIQRGWKHIP
jgi:hypothetical protein